MDIQVKRLTKCRSRTLRAPIPTGLGYGAPGNAPPYTVYAAHDQNRTIAVSTLGADGTLTQTGSNRNQVNRFPSGVATDSKGVPPIPPVL